MFQQTELPLLLVASLILSGCTSMTGLSGGSSYACKAPEGVACDSVSGTYANAVQNNLPSQQRAAGVNPTAPAAPRPSMAAANSARGAVHGTAIAPASPLQATPASSAGRTPLRSSARILRLWFKPWEDADRDLYDQGYVYVQIDGGQWLVDHAQRQIRDAYAPLRPPPRAPTAAADQRDGTLPQRPSIPQLPNLAAPALLPSAPSSND